MIKAVLLDFGGVLTTSPFEAFNRYEYENNIPKDFIRKINSNNHESNAWALFESSRISLEEFNDLFEQETKKAGYPIPGFKVLELLGGDLRPRMVNALKRCKERFKTACITNNMKSGMGPVMVKTEKKASEMEKVMHLFDVVVESSVEGIRKPDPRIYKIAVSLLDVNPDQIVFLDDLGINLKPARAMGMKTIKVINEDQALKELEEITGLPKL